MSSNITIGLLGGSFRNLNGAGITSWVHDRLDKLAQAGTFNEKIKSVVLTSANTPLPLGPVTEPKLPAMISKSSDYVAEADRKWSEIVSSLSALIIITPQYNFGYPGELKNAIDHLFNEWKDLPVVIVSFGGAGGEHAEAQLKQVLDQGVHTKIISSGEVKISLPTSCIVGGELANRTSEFLKEYEKETDDALIRLAKAAIEFKQTKKQ